MIALFILTVVAAWVVAYVIEKRWGLRWALAFLFIVGAVLGGVEVWR
jgi:hypothetical protein